MVVTRPRILSTGVGLASPGRRRQSQDADRHDDSWQAKRDVHEISPINVLDDCVTRHADALGAFLQNELDMQVQ